MLKSPFWSILVYAFTVVGAIYTLMFLYFNFGGVCESKVVGLVRSPSGAMEARAESLRCPGEPDSIRALLTDSETGLGLLVLDAEFDGKAPIQFVWKDETKLEIAYPWGVVFSNAAETYEGVEITYHSYDPPGI